MKGSDEKLFDKIEAAKSRRKTVRITLTLGTGTWRAIEQLMKMFGMTQREIFDLCHSFFSKMDFSRIVEGIKKDPDGQIKKTVVISERLNRFLGKESEIGGFSKSVLLNIMVRLLLGVATEHREEVMEKVKRSVSILSRVFEEIDKADEQLQEIWGEEEWDRINENSMYRLSESGIIVDNLIGDLEDMIPESHD